MARRTDAHLTTEEIEALVSPSLGRTIGFVLPKSDWEEVQDHLAACDDCRRITGIHAKEAGRLNSLKVGGSVERRADCPPEETWLHVAAGAMLAGETARYLEHASVCDFCGRLMRRTTEDFADELTPKEEMILASLETGKPEWQRRMADRMKAESDPRRKFGRWSEAVAAFFRWPNLAWTATAAVVIASIGPAIQLLRPASATELLAKAYTEQRSLELRFPGAGYAPVRVQKGGGDRSRLDRPAALLDAEARIARELAAHPDSTAWLQSKGRADLLEWNYEAAIKSFKRALEAEPDSPVLQADLAAAYFERAEAADRAIDYGTTIELLAKALKARPDDPVMLFNYALVLEKMFVYHQAIETWQHYLRIDSKSGWSSEARRRLAELEQKKKEHDKSSAPPPADPAAFLQRAGAESEDYLDIAIVQWLPAFFSNEPNEKAGAALEKLAGLLRSQHGDRWLEDLLKASPSPNFSRGVASLGKAVKADLAGNPSEAEQESKSAQQSFRAAGSPPGALRARLEQVYALHRSAEGKRCLAEALPLATDLQGKNYLWSEAQLLIEQLTCWTMVNDIGAAQNAAGRARSATVSAAFGTLGMRSLGLSAALDVSVGNYLAAWSLNRSGLAGFWSGVFPPVRGYQFYMNLHQAAERQNQKQAALVMIREAVVAIASTANRSTEAMARDLLATTASAADEVSEAAAEFERANCLFTELPQSLATRRYRMRGQLGLAMLEAQRGELDLALRRLNGVRGEVALVTDDLYPFWFHRTLGTLHRRRGENVEAEQDLEAAIRIAQRRLSSVTNDHDRLLWTQETGEAYRTLVRQKLENRRDSKGALELWQWFRATTMRCRPVPLETSCAGAFRGDLLSPPDIRDTLPELPQETVLSYVQFADGLAIWSFDDRGITSHWVPVTEASIRKLTQRFADQCSDPGSSLATLRRDGRQLYEWLIAPVAGRLAESRTLVIEPDGPIAGIPFQALVDPGGRYLGERFALASSPGIWVTRSLRGDTAVSASDLALVVGMPAVPPEMANAFPPLGEAAREAKVVAAHFSAATLLSGENATIEALDGKLAHSAVFHFAGHGTANAEGGALLLARQGGGVALFSSTRVRPELLRRCRLAVLSACASGNGEKEGPANPDSLVRAFLNGGVPHVVASRWNIDSASTSALMSNFYRTLLAGATVSRSLKAAATEVQNHTETAHPFFWAGLNVFGRP